MKKLPLIFALVCATCYQSPAQTAAWQLTGATIRYDSSNQPYFDFPKGIPFVSHGVGYLYTPVSRLNTKTGISITYTITTTGTPVFDWRTNPNNTCTGVAAKARLFIWLYPDNTSQYGRYWSTDGFADLTAGQITIKADFNPARWTDVYGQTGSANPTQWATALQTASMAGVTFGGGCFYGHGVFIDYNTGTARFTINSFGAY